MDFVTEIYCGNYDNDLNRIAAAIKDRRDQLAAKVRCQLYHGAKVRFRDTVKPSYLAGAEATVTGMARKRVTVVLPRSYGRFMKGSPLRCPVSILELVK